jgi:hypothetical protein
MSSLGNGGSSQLKEAVGADYSVSEKDYLLQFSKQPVMSNFGDLSFGEIPEPLKFVRPFQTTTISNGIRVCTEAWPTT